MVPKQLIILYSVISVSYKGALGFKQQVYLQGCDKRSCYPATGNILIGRGENLTASDTCGLNNKERYCIISSLDPHTYGGSNSMKEKCYNCDATDPELSHDVDSIIHRWEPPGAPRSSQKMTWWQASNGNEKVTLQLDLEAEFHVTHIIITFKTFRPAGMYIEKSYDWGQTWKIYRYFAYDCAKEFPGVHIGVPRYLNETVCQGKYSKLAPSTKGEVIYRVLPPNIKFNSPGFNPYSKEVQDLLKTTNLRVTFTKLHTLGDDKFEDANAIDIREKYYYSIYDMVVRGSCSCYGHAARCVPAKEEHRDIPGMIHGTCECDHNTMGNNCEYCKEFYRDLPWRPATGKKKNECKRCNCNEHSDKCEFDPRVFAASAETSGGVCIDCKHNTEGTHCEMCMEGFYQDPARQITDPDICAPCDCEPDGTIDEGKCDERTNEEEGTVAGQCHCKTYVGGPRCDHCKPGYWNFTTENPDGCQQCSCNPLGTVDGGGGCNEQTGECQCKANVARVRDCDQCLPEHYGLSESDPNGCKPCDCDPGGSFHNHCNVTTGECLCRPNIKGRRCDQVEDFKYTGPFDYLLYEAELAHGTGTHTVIKKKPSEIPGQTTWTGFGYMQVFEGSTLTFDIPEIHRTMNYFPVIRYANDPSYTNNWEDVTIELVRYDGAPNDKCSSSTDAQTMQLMSGGINAESYYPFCLEKSQRYQIKITFNRYGSSEPVKGAKVFIDSIALLPDIDDIPFLNPALESMMDTVVADGLIPIGEGSYYTTTTTTEAPTTRPWINPNMFNPFGVGPSQEEGSGMSLEPEDTYSYNKGSDDLMMQGWFPGREKVEWDRSEFERLDCRRHFLQAKPGRLDPMPKECERILYSISFLTFHGAINRNCTCHDTGSITGMCDKYYGDCECKTLVVGRQCDSCAPAAFGFSSSGCQRCDCHHLGSQDEFCNHISGQCTCNTQQPTFGRKCDECKPGFWNFPNCQKCECNDHTQICHQDTGVCINCRDNTRGNFCDECEIGFYGRPERREDKDYYIACKECRCPETRASGHSYAETCYLDEQSEQSICHCEDGYDGDRCDICSDNFFGHPELPGGECKPCDCSNNWDSTAEGNCDAHTGKCLKCLFYTEGWNCERCVEGYYGDAVNSQCMECQCDLLGTDQERKACDRETGECNCLPNVVGKYCSECKENHWKIASGEGCIDCACDPVGSTGEQCDVYTGQCDCKPGFGGERCDQCETDFWGDPKKECIPCNCSPMGVNPEQSQCDHQTGKCFCLEGIGGEKCDECDVGYVQNRPIGPDHEVQTRLIPYGERPNCVPCGECFTNWKRILQVIQRDTTQRVEEAEKVKITGAAGAYTTSFEDMESKISEVNKIIDRSSLKNEELATFTHEIKGIEDKLTETTNRIKQLDNSLTETEQSILQGQYNLTTLRQDADRLHNQASDIRDKATQLQEANVGGALTLTQQAKERSDLAARKVKAINKQVEGGLLYDSLETRGRTQEWMKTKDINASLTNNSRELNEVTNEISRLEDRIPQLNKAVCDGETSRENPCDDLCGGAGCGKCGDVSCGEGALTKSQDALNDAKDAEMELKKKDLVAEEALNKIRVVHKNVQNSAELAQTAFDMANDAMTRSQTESEKVEELTKKIDDFLKDDNATPEQVKAVAQECLDAVMNKDPAAIQELADQINEATASVTDVDKINEQTREPLQKAENLKRLADKAKMDAENELTRAQNVTQNLGSAEDAQTAAEEAIKSALENIEAARRDLGFITSEMDDATSASKTTFEETKELLKTQKQLQTAYISNENHVKKAQTAAEGAKTQASKANSDLYKLNFDFKNVSESLSHKESNIGSAKNRALSLQKRASALSNSASQKLADLLDMEKQYEDNQKELEELSETLTSMNCQMQIHLLVIQDKSNFYTACQPPSTWEPAQDCNCDAGLTEPECIERASPARY